MERHWMCWILCKKTTFSLAAYPAQLALGSVIPAQ